MSGLEELFCWSCDYALRGATGRRCPECGAEIDHGRSAAEVAHGRNRRQFVLGWVGLAAASVVAYALLPRITPEWMTGLAWALLGPLWAAATLWSGLVTARDRGAVLPGVLLAVSVLATPLALLAAFAGVLMAAP